MVKRFESFRVFLLIIGFYIMFKGLQYFIDGLFLEERESQLTLP